MSGPLPDLADVVVIGAGPAGSATAAGLAQAGWRVVLVEKDTFPRDKLCGEFLSGESQRLLERLGCLDQIRNAGPPTITRARFTVPTGRAVTMDLPEPAFGISRLELDARLAAHAERCGATLLCGTSVRSIAFPSGEPANVTLGDGRMAHAPLIVGAWGRHTPLDRELGRAFMQQPQPYVGFKLHHRIEDASGRTADALRGVVEVHTFDGGYCGFNFVESGEVNACMLLQHRTLDRMAAAPDAATLRDMLARQSSPLADRLAAMKPSADRPLAVGRVPFTTKEVTQHGGRLLFVGDAAGVIAPLVGDGQAMALHSAALLVRCLLDSDRRPARWSAADTASCAARYAHAHIRQFRMRLAIGNRLQSALFNPRLARWLIGLLHHAPGIADWLVRATRG